MTSSRKLEVGAKVRTDFSGKFTDHTITAVVALPGSASAVGFYVTPLVPGSTGGPINADWFEPLKEQS